MSATSPELFPLDQPRSSNRWRWRSVNRQVINAALFSGLIVALIANQFLLTKNRALAGVSANDFLTKVTVKLSGGSAGQLTGEAGQDAIALALAQGTPDIYGSELGVNFAQVQASMDVMAAFDPTYGNKKIVLTGDLLQRYVNVGMKIACEFCCGATALVRPDGQAACGCAHSQAMRGLAAYLLQNHATEYSDDQILRELARWKGSYFPKAMVGKISQQLSSGEYTPDVAALLLDLKVPAYNGTSTAAPLPSDIELPGQVGGC